MLLLITTTMLSKRTELRTDIPTYVCIVDKSIHHSIIPFILNNYHYITLYFHLLASGYCFVIFFFCSEH